jgi:hypothetical protein
VETVDTVHIVATVAVQTKHVEILSVEERQWESVRVSAVRCAVRDRDAMVDTSMTACDYT